MSGLGYRTTQGHVMSMEQWWNSDYLSMSLQPFVGLWTLFSFLIFYTVGRTPWTGDQPVARHTGQHKQNKRTLTSML
jgi:hypothetical protein